VGIAKSLQEETGTGRGDVMTWNSSMFIINRDPFRSIRRGRQLFQRKFTRLQGQGGNEGDGAGDLNTNKGNPTLKQPLGNPFLVKNIFTDFKRA
jgi:hypothetical protein